MALDIENGSVELRPYQVECIDAAVGRGSLLVAMTMGSGKTITACRVVRQLRQEGRARRGAVFALKSTKYQWMREIQEKGDPGTRVQVVEGDKAARVFQLSQAHRYHYTILHYQTLIHDWAEIKKYLPLDFVICDEVTAIKSFTSKTSRRMKALRNASLFRYGLSGQPVENRPEELFSIMEWIDPDVLGPFPKFDRTFITRDYWGNAVQYKNLSQLHERLGDAMFRRSRQDIAEWLPTLVEMEIPVRLDSWTMKLHDRIKYDLVAALDEAGFSGGGFDILAHYGKTENNADGARKGAVMSRLLCMRMLASHPHLLKLSADNFDDDAITMGSEYASTLKKEGLLEGMPKSSPKLDATIETIMEILEENPFHKVVVFSFFKPMLQLMGEELAKRKVSYVTMTGDTKTRDRDTAIRKFNENVGTRVFLSSDAGAYGVNLDKGSHLISYDFPWSVGKLAQRVARIDRTSSSFDKIVISYVYGANTIEERMYDQLTTKMAVANAWVDGDFDPKTGALPLDFQSLREFLVGDGV